MSKKSIMPQTSRHIIIYDEDWELLETCYGASGLKPIGISTVLRALIHQFVTQIREAQISATTNAKRSNTPNANPPNISSVARGATGVDI